MMAERSLDELLDRAIAALNRGEVDHAHDLASEVLVADAGNLDAGVLLTTSVQPRGELRRLTVMFCDLVGSTEASARLEPEAYRTIVAGYQAVCRAAIQDRYGGSIVALKGDGILASFGFPVAHEDDADRAVRAGLDILGGIERARDAIAGDNDVKVAVRVAVHKGVVFLDRDENDLYGFTVNVAARLEGLAETGTLLVSEEVRRLIGDRFDLEAHEPRHVKGVDEPLVTYTVLGERVGARPPLVTGPLVGREAEVAALRCAWAAARDGDRVAGACTAVVGEAGLGKSRLVGALAEAVEADRGVVAVVGGSPLHQASGLWPVRRFIEQRCGFTRHSDARERLALLRTSVGASGAGEDDVVRLAALLGIPPAAGYAPAESDARRLREEIGDAAAAYLRRAFGGGPGVLVFEDLHWFDDESRDLVGRFVRDADPAVAVVVTSRSGDVVPRGAGSTVLALGPLGSAEGRALLEAHGTGGLEPEVVERILQAGDGVPLFLEELLRAAVQDTRPAPTAPPFVLPAVPAVPDVLYEPLLARLNVTPAGAALAAAAATIGRDADHRLLAEVSGLGPADLEDALASLLGTLVLEPADPDRGRYQFRHELVRAAAYDLQPPTQRRRLHGRVADVLADAADPASVDWALVGAHYETAERAGDAADAFERAAEASRRRGALDEARTLLGRAIALVAADPAGSATRETRLRLQRGFLALSAEGNSSADAAVDYERCLELSMGPEPTDEMISTLVALFSYYSSRAEFDRAAALLDVVIAAGPGDREATSGIVHGAYGLVEWYRGDFRKALEHYDAAERELRDVRPDSGYTSWWYIPIDPIATARSSRGMPLLMMGRVDEAAAYDSATADAVADLAFPQGPFTKAGALSFEAWIAAEKGDPARAVEVVDELAALAGRYGFDSWAIVAATQREVYEAMVLVARGLDDASRATVRQRAAMVGTYMSMWKMIDQWVFVTYYTTVQGVLHAAAGETEAAAAALDEAIAIGERTGMRFYQAESLRHRAALHADPTDRVAGIRAALELAEHQGAALFALRAAIDLFDATGERGPLERAVDRIAATPPLPDQLAARERLSRP